MIYLLALTCLVLPVYLVRVKILGIPTTFLEILIYLAALVQISFLVRLKNFSNLRPRILHKARFLVLTLSNIYLPIVLLLLAGIISTIISPDKRTSLGILKGWFFDPILLGALVALNVRSEKDFGKIVCGLAAGGAFVAMWGILQWFGFDFLLSHQKADPFNSFASYLDAGRAFGPFESPNYLGMYLAPIVALTIGYWLNLKLKMPKSKLQSKLQNSYFLSFCLIAMLLSLLFTKSLGAWLGFAVAVTFLGYFMLKSYFINHQSYLIILVAISAAVGYLLLNKIGTGRLVDSFTARKEVWQVSWHLIKEWPVFGIGLGTFRSLYEQTIPQIHFPPINWLQMHPHNVFLTFWLNLGLLGLISFVWILVLLFKKSLRSHNSYSIILNSAMIAIITHGLIDTTYWKNDLSAIFWIIIGLTYSRFQNQKSK